MKTLHKTIFSIIGTLYLLVFTLLSVFYQSQWKAYAVDDTIFLDSSSVMEDLRDSDLDAVTDEYIGDGLYVFSFEEYCFSYDTELNGKYGLYVYAYNPSQKSIVNGTQHRITLGVNYDETEVIGYDKFNLRCLSVSDDGLFVKFKIIDKTSSVTGETILSRISKSKLKRIYDVAEIEVCHEYGMIAEAYKVGKRYIFTGFAKGYGINTDGESTLDCFSEDSTVVPLEVHATQYRPQGSNGKNAYTQDSLHSVYFTVPKEYSENYGDMTAVHATWLEALLKPALVTGNQDAYSAISSYLGTDLYTLDGNENGGLIKDIGFYYLGSLTQEPFADGGYDQYWYGYSFNFPDTPPSSKFKKAYYGSVVNPLYIMFNSGSNENSADTFVPPSEGDGSLIQKMREATAIYGGDLVEERYSRVLFESVSEQFTDKTISSTDGFDIRNVSIIEYKWWQKLFGHPDHELDENTLNNYQNVKGIEEVTDSVMSLSPEEVCETLKIGLHDYNAFKQYYEENKENGTVYLFRYRISDYVAQEATTVKYSGGSWKIADSNAYFFQEECDIGFDVIDITFTNTEGEHVLGVVAKPIDVFPTPTPPLIVHEETHPWWHYVVAFLLLVLAIIVAFKLVKYALSHLFKR